MAHTERPAILFSGARRNELSTIILTQDTVPQMFSYDDSWLELRDVRRIPSSDADALPAYVTISLQDDISEARSWAQEK